MVEKNSSVINFCCDNHTERIAAYRLINNHRLVMENVVGSLSSVCSSGCEGLSHVLCLQDTTEIVFCQEGRLSLDDKDFGYGTSEHEKYSIFTHPGIVLDASSRMPVGFGHMKVWSRDRSEERRKKQCRSKVKLEYKESYCWVETAEKTVASLPSGIRVTMFGNRENDVYSVMCKTLGYGCDLFCTKFFMLLTIVCNSRNSRHSNKNDIDNDEINQLECEWPQGLRRQRLQR